MSEFEKFKKKFLRKDYKFIRTYKKDFGEYIIGEYKTGLFGTDKRVMIYHFTKSPTIKRFGKVVKDFERAFKQFDRNYNVKGGYFVVHGSYDKEGFRLVLRGFDDEIRDLIKIVTLKEEKPIVVKKEVKPKRESAKPKASEVKQVLRRIKRFTPYKRAKKEKELETMLVSYLRAHYPDMRTQLTYERARIDAQIGKIGIEIKYQPSEFDRLYGQIEKYLKHLDYVIAVIGYEKSKETTRDFKKRLKARGWLDDRVFVISVS